MNAFDTAVVTTGYAHDILAAGYEAVGIYLRPDRAPLAMVQGFQEVGIKIFSIWEKGEPISGDYFSAEKGQADGQAAIAYAGVIGQTAGSQIFASVDYDPDWDQDGDAITAYFQAFQTVVKAAGYLSSVYGSGLTCSQLIDAGLAHTGFLSVSRGFRGYAEFKPNAAIIQEAQITVLDRFQVDPDTVVDPTVCWQ